MKDDAANEASHKKKAIVFVALALSFGLTLLISGILDSFLFGVRVASILFTVTLLAGNAIDYRSGRIGVKGGGTFRRDANPRTYWIVAGILWTLQMMICAVFVWLAFRNP